MPQKALSGILGESQLKLLRSLNQNDFIGQNFDLMQMLGMDANGDNLLGEVEMVIEGQPE